MDNFRDSYFQINWDLGKKRLNNSVWGKQYDTGRGLAITLINNGIVVTPSNEIIRLKWEKSDGTAGYVNSTVVSGKFLLENIDQMFTVAGMVKADLELQVAGEFVASVTFFVSVDKAIAVDAIESSSDFTALQDALADVGDVKSLLAESTNQVTYKNDALKAVVTFVDDDGADDVISVLKPIFDAKGIAGCCSIITGFIDTPNYMTSANLQTLKVAGWEFLGHGHSYANNLSEFPLDADLEYQLDTGCKQWLESRGYLMKGFVYPQSVSDERIRRFTRKHYEYSFAGAGINTDNLMDTMQINRISIGSASNPAVNGNSESNTLAYYKACVDYAKTNKAWLVFTTHIATTDATQQGYLSQLIDYIQASGVEIMTASNAHKIHANKIFAGDVATGSYTIVNKKGKTYASESIVTPLGVNALASTVLASGYPNKAISVFYVTAGGNTGFPNNASGTVTTYRFGGSGYDYQVFQRYATYETYMRKVKSDGSWYAWESTNNVYVAPLDTYNLTTIPYTFRLGKTFCVIGGSNPSWGTLPIMALGTLITYKMSVSGNETYQEYQYRGSTTLYRRIWDPVGNAWLAWNKVYWLLADQKDGYDCQVNQTVNAFTAAQLITAYLNGKVTTFAVNGAGATGFPDNAAGLVTTYRIGGNGFDRQEFRKYMTNELWSRYVDGTGAWTTWVKISA